MSTARVPVLGGCAAVPPKPLRSPGPAVLHAEVSRHLQAAGVGLAQAAHFADQLGPAWRHFAEALGRQSDEVLQMSIEQVDDAIAGLAAEDREAR